MTERGPTFRQIQGLVDAGNWNERHPVGTRVLYRPPGNPRKAILSKTRSEATTLEAGDAVIFIEDVPGAVLVEALAVRPTEHRYEDLPKCPWCDTPMDSDDACELTLCDGQSTEVDCAECEREYRVLAHVQWTYDTEPAAQSKEGEPCTSNS